MNEAIDLAFETMIKERGIHKKLDIPSVQVRVLRYNLANGIPISTERKVRLLKKSGWSPEEVKYSRKDLVSLLKFYERTSQAARDLGLEYVIEKWEQKKATSEG